MTYIANRSAEIELIYIDFTDVDYVVISMRIDVNQIVVICVTYLETIYFLVRSILFTSYRYFFHAFINFVLFFVLLLHFLHLVISPRDYENFIQFNHSYKPDYPYYSEYSA